MQVKSPGRVHVDHVMWQPIFNCKMGCDKCYVAESPAAKYNGPVTAEIIDLVFSKYISEDKKNYVVCGQFTVSLDSLIEFPTTLLDELNSLWSLYKEADDCGCETTTKKSIDNNQLPELCVTAFNMNTINNWCSKLGMTLHQFLAPLTVLSLSNLPVQGKKCLEIQEACKATRTVLNYNKMINSPKDIESKSFEMGVRYADHVYLVLKKSPLGQEQNVEDMINLFKAVKHVPPEKLTRDACITDAVKKINTNFKCGAGIQKVHVWPDGSVTGCPYDAHHKAQDTYENHTEGKTFSVWEQIDTVVNSPSCHPMDFCGIPAALRSVNDKVNNQKKELDKAG